METKKLAEFSSAIKYENLSAKTLRKTKQCILEWLGVCIMGAQEPPIKIIRKVLLPTGGDNKATVLDGKNEKTSALNAAFCNAAASHSLDFDDLHCPSIIHLAAIVIPPIFALAEAEHKNGKEMLAATVAGYEVGARAGEAVVPESYYFWHTTATAGIFGAGAAAARILGLDAATTVQTLGSAGTQAAGLWEFLADGSMSKTLHAGKGAYAGVLSACLAREGFTGASKILEGEKGFCRAMLAKPHLEKLLAGLGQGYKIDQNSFKPYPCCKHAHSSAFATQVMREENRLKPADIASIELYVNNLTNTLINSPAPENAYGCKFSIQYCVAAMLKYGKLTIEQFNPALINDQEVRALMTKIKVIQDKEIEAIHANDPTKYAAKVVINCLDGKKLSMQVDYPKGDPPNPMSWEESVEKFKTLAVPVYGGQTAAKLCALVDKLEEADDFAKALQAALQ